MTTNPFKFIAKRAVSTFILAAVVTVSVSAASRHEHLPKDSSDKNATVVCLGKKNDQFLVKVSYVNEKGNKFNVSVKDKEGFVIFQDTFTDRKFDKLFKIQKE